MNKSENPWSVPVAMEDIPDTGLHLDIEAPAATRAAVAALADLRAVEALSAAFDLTRKGAGVHVTGKVRGRVGQTCVVTLDPVENAIEELVDLDFAPTERTEALGAEIKSLEPSDEPPEALIGGKLDLGALATEFLMLGIDPYPRKPGAEFSPPPTGDTGEHPFAALAALKKSPERES
jgi:hypothetical protein